MKKAIFLSIIMSAFCCSSGLEAMEKEDSDAINAFSNSFQCEQANLNSALKKLSDIIKNIGVDYRYNDLKKRFDDFSKLCTEKKEKARNSMSEILDELEDLNKDAEFLYNECEDIKDQQKHEKNMRRRYY